MAGLRKRRILTQALVACLAMTLSGVTGASSQESSALNQSRAPFLTLDQDKLFAETQYGQRVLSEVNEVSRALAERNRQITAELTAEEKALTEKRAEISAEEFRNLADAFDEKVTTLRTEQDVRIRSLQRKREQDRVRFNTRVAPALMSIVREWGAVAILDERAVILSAEQYDMTDEAIARVDEMFGDGSEVETVQPLETPGESGETPPEPDLD